MRVSDSNTSIQLLKAQQAWEARRSAKTAAPAEPAKSQPASHPARIEIDTRLPETPVGPANNISPQWRNTVREVQQIAQRAGFIGVSEQDIQRAYARGESLLADYRV